MIRPARTKDAKSVFNLLGQLGYSSKLNRIEEILSSSNEDSQSTVYVYELSGKVVGFISLMQFLYFPTAQNIMRVTALCVDAEYRNLSIGSQLLKFAEKLAESSGDAFIEISCSLEREQAHQFYLKHQYSKHSYKFVKRLLA